MNNLFKDSDGRTPLHVAAWQGYTDIVQVQIVLWSRSRYIALHYVSSAHLLVAEWQGYTDIVQVYIVLWT